MLSVFSVAHSLLPCRGYGTHGIHGRENRFGGTVARLNDAHLPLHGAR